MKEELGDDSLRLEQGKDYRVQLVAHLEANGWHWTRSRLQ
jgi:hypothetical protein